MEGANMKTPRKIDRFSLLDTDWGNDPLGNSAVGKNPLLLGGKSLAQAGLPKTTPLKAIRAKCLDCVCNQYSEVRNCISLDCDLWPFRMGSNPYQKRGGGLDA